MFTSVKASLCLRWKFVRKLKKFCFHFTQRFSANRTQIQILTLKKQCKWHSWMSNFYFEDLKSTKILPLKKFFILYSFFSFYSLSTKITITKTQMKIHVFIKFIHVVDAERNSDEPLVAQMLRPLWGRFRLILDGRRCGVYETPALIPGSAQEIRTRGTGIWFPGKFPGYKRKFAQPESAFVFGVGGERRTTGGQIPGADAPTATRVEPCKPGRWDPRYD